MLERLENARKPISILFMIIINCVLIGSLIYLSLSIIPAHQIQSTCWNYFFDLKEKAGLSEIPTIIVLNETEKILKWGGYFNQKAIDEINERTGYSKKICACLCNETER